MTRELTHQKPSANRGAIAPNLPKRRHERLTASDKKPLAHSKHRRRCRGAPPSRHLLAVFGCVAGLFLIFGCAPPSSIIFSFNFHALKSFAFNFQHTSFNLHHRSWSQTEFMSITSNSYGEGQKSLILFSTSGSNPQFLKVEGPVLCSSGSAEIGIGTLRQVSQPGRAGCVVYLGDSWATAQERVRNQIIPLPKPQAVFHKKRELPTSIREARLPHNARVVPSALIFHKTQECPQRSSSTKQNCALLPQNDKF